MRRETESGRVAAIGAVLAAVQPQIADRALTDVVLTGDFNAPAHLDWTEATRAQHCDIGAVAWPATRAVEQAGLVDTYRPVHADPAADAGNTWSPIRPDHREAEPQDRNCRPEYLYTTANSCIDENRSVAPSPKQIPQASLRERAKATQGLNSRLLLPQPRWGRRLG